MPGNFDKRMKISKDGCLSPSGPLVLAEGETVLRLDVWIWQEHGACIATLRNIPAGSKKWKIPENHRQNHAGRKFRPDPAAAMGIMVSKMADGQTKTFQWTEGILLVAGKPSAITPH